MEIQTPLVLFTLFLCLSTGLMGFQGYMFVTGKGTNKFHQVTLITTVVALAVGGIAVFTHLQHWERIFNGFGHITSGITHELILVVAMGIAMVAAFVVARKGSEEGAIPSKGFGIAFIVIAVIGGFVTAHSYDMYARPAWNNIFLYLYYYSSELLLGSGAIWTLCTVLKEPEENDFMFGKCTFILGIAATVVMILSMFFIANITPNTIDGITFYTYDPTHAAADPASDLAAALTGSYAGLFWGGAVLVGGVLPAAVAALVVAKKQPATNIVMPAVALLTAFIGGICYRVALYVVGIASYVYFF